MPTQSSCGDRPYWGQIRTWLLAIACLLLLYLCWLIVKPFLPAVCWAFGLALVAQPFHQWLCRKVSRPNLAAAIAVIVIAVVLVTPAIVLTRVLAAEAATVAQQFASEEQRESLRSEVNSNRHVRTVLDWLGSRVDLNQEVGVGGAQAGRLDIVFGRDSRHGLDLVRDSDGYHGLRSVLFLTRRPLILSAIASVLPLSESDTQRIFARIGETIRVSLYGKLLVASIQGSLGGLIFWCVGLPAPVLLGFSDDLGFSPPVVGNIRNLVPCAVIAGVAG